MPPAWQGAASLILPGSASSPCSPTALSPAMAVFPPLTALITMFFAGTAGGLLSSLGSALFLTLFVLLGIGASFVSSWLLSRTVLKGIPSSFTLELPPYRRPQAGRVLLRSILDRTVFVLGRAASIAAPAGLIIWLMANVRLDGASLLAHCCAFLNPLGQALGMDGVILTRLSSGTSGQRDCDSAHSHGLPLPGNHGRSAKPCPAQTTSDRQWLDLGHGPLHHDFFPDALALFHYPAHHQKGVRLVEMDGSGLSSAHGVGDGTMLSPGFRREDVFIGDPCICLFFHIE